ncbi:hypothetical protein TGVAND_238980 [Toxoplasma gondii VAND]|uniref:Uncharacterized protein n=1 Tax=Toxoplasma gondii VAND TaxID=933077 RepID=A0A086PUW8_TOXGO|nr:hypothetical protein TGVAND_238980 [Toxoplasma gondii VAND]
MPQPRRDDGLCASARSFAGVTRREREEQESKQCQGKTRLLLVEHRSPQGRRRTLHCISCLLFAIILAGCTLHVDLNRGGHNDSRSGLANLARNSKWQLAAADSPWSFIAVAAASPLRETGELDKRLESDQNSQILSPQKNEDELRGEPAKKHDLLERQKADNSLLSGPFQIDSGRGSRNAREERSSLEFATKDEEQGNDIDISEASEKKGTLTQAIAGDHRPLGEREDAQLQKNEVKSSFHGEEESPTKRNATGDEAGAFDDTTHANEVQAESNSPALGQAGGQSLQDSRSETPFVQTEKLMKVPYEAHSNVKGDHADVGISHSSKVNTRARVTHAETPRITPPPTAAPLEQAAQAVDQPETAQEVPRLGVDSPREDNKKADRQGTEDAVSLASVEHAETPGITPPPTAAPPEQAAQAVDQLEKGALRKVQQKRIHESVQLLERTRSDKPRSNPVLGRDPNRKPEEETDPQDWESLKATGDSQTTEGVNQAEKERSALPNAGMRLHRSNVLLAKAGTGRETEEDLRAKQDSELESPGDSRSPGGGVLGQQREEGQETNEERDTNATTADVPASQTARRERGKSGKASEQPSSEGESPQIFVDVLQLPRQSSVAPSENIAGSPVASVSMSEVEDDSTPRVEMGVKRAAAEVDADVGSFLEQMQIFDPEVKGLRRGLASLLVASLLLPAFHFRGTSLSSDIHDLCMQREELAGSTFFGLVFYGVSSVVSFLNSLSRQRQFRKSLARIQAGYFRKRQLALTAAASAAARRRFRQQPFIRPAAVKTKTRTAKKSPRIGIKRPNRHAADARLRVENRPLAGGARTDTGQAQASREANTKRERVTVASERKKGEATAPRETVGREHEGGGHAGGQRGPVDSQIEQAMGFSGEPQPRQATSERRMHEGGEKGGSKGEERAEENGKPRAPVQKNKKPNQVDIKTAKQELPLDVSIRSRDRRVSVDLDLFEASMSRHKSARQVPARNKSEPAGFPLSSRAGDQKVLVQSSRGDRLKHSAVALKAKPVVAPKTQESTEKHKILEAPAESQSEPARDAAGTKASPEADSNLDPQKGRHGPARGRLSQAEKTLGSPENEGRKNRWGAWIVALERGLRKHVNGDELTGRRALKDATPPCSADTTPPATPQNVKVSWRPSASRTPSASPLHSESHMKAQPASGLAGRDGSPHGGTLSGAADSEDDEAEELGDGADSDAKKRVSVTRARALTRQRNALFRSGRAKAVKAALLAAKADLMDQAFDALTIRQLCPINGAVGIIVVLFTLLYSVAGRLGPESTQAASDTVSDPTSLAFLVLTFLVSLVRLQRSTKRLEAQRTLMEKRRQQKARSLLRNYSDTPEGWRRQRIHAPLVYAPSGREDAGVRGGAGEGNWRGSSAPPAWRRGLVDWVAARQKRREQERGKDMDQQFHLSLGVEKHPTPDATPEQRSVTRSGWRAKLMRGLRRRLRQPSEKHDEVQDEGSEAHENELSFEVHDLAMEDVSVQEDLTPR